MPKEDIKKITEYIFLESKPQKADLAFVFGTRHKEAIAKAYKLYNSKLVTKILVSGGINRVTGENEAQKMSRELIKLGVDKDDIFLEDKSTNSLENVLFSKKLIKEKIGFDNIKKIVAVVKHYHSRRALMTFKKHFPESVKIILTAYNIYGFAKNNWHKTTEGKRKVMGELDKIKKYLLKGDIEEI